MGQTDRETERQIIIMVYYNNNGLLCIAANGWFNT